jgi:hypothetical protein
MSVKEKVNTFFDKLPFRGMAEKIPAETRAKAPVLNRVIPFANQIACGLVVVLLVTAIVACSGGKKESGKSSGSSAKSNAKAAPASDFKYELTADKKGVRIKSYTGNAPILVIPATIEDMPVMEYGDVNDTSLFTYPLINGDNFRELVLPDSITGIRISAFRNTPLTKITLPKGLKKIPYGAFMDCSNLETINLPDGIETIEGGAFMRCEDLKTINLPASLKEIGVDAFFNCGELNNLIIPDSLSSIKFLPNLSDKNDAFMGCGKLPLKTRSRLEELGYKGKI